jgi:hypothetical protein
VLHHFPAPKCSLSSSSCFASIPCPSSFGFTVEMVLSAMIRNLVWRTWSGRLGLGDLNQWFPPPHAVYFYHIYPAVPHQVLSLCEALAIELWGSHSKEVHERTCTPHVVQCCERVSGEHVLGCSLDGLTYRPCWAVWACRTTVVPLW